MRTSQCKGHLTGPPGWERGAPFVAGQLQIVLSDIQLEVSATSNSVTLTDARAGHGHPSRCHEGASDDSDYEGTRDSKALDSNSMEDSKHKLRNGGFPKGTVRDS